MQIRGIHSFERIDTDTKQRYKMYKSGRQWVYAGLITTFFVTLPILNNQVLNANADTTDATTKATAVTESSSGVAAAAATTDATAQKASAQVASANVQSATATSQSATNNAASQKTVESAPTIAQPTVTVNGDTATLTGTATAGATINVSVNGASQTTVTASGTGTYTVSVKAGQTVTLTATRNGQTSSSVTVSIPSQAATSTAAKSATSAASTKASAASDATSTSTKADSTVATDTSAAKSVSTDNNVVAGAATDSQSTSTSSVQNNLVNSATTQENSASNGNAAQPAATNTANDVATGQTFLSDLASQKMQSALGVSNAASLLRSAVLAMPTVEDTTVMTSSTDPTTTGSNGGTGVGLTSTPTQTYNADGTFTVTGQATAGSRVTFKSAAGATIVSANTASNGTYVATLNNVNSGDQVSIVVTKDGVNSTAQLLTLTNNTTDTSSIGKTGLLEGQVFGKSGYTVDNTATAQLGQTDAVAKMIKQANAANLNQKNSGKIYDESGTAVNPTIDNSADNNDSYDDDILYGGKTYVSGANKVASVGTDFMSDQGAISSDDNNLKTRYTDIIAAIENPGLSVKLLGSTTNGATFGFDNRISNSVKVGTWTVQSANRAGAIVKNDNTGETFQITDATSMSNNLFGQAGVKAGDKLSNTAVIETTFSGGPIENLFKIFTSGITGILSAFGVVALVPDTIAQIVAIVPSLKQSAYYAGLESSVQKVKDDQAALASLGGSSLAITKLANVTKQADGTYKVLNDSTLTESLTNYLQSWVNTWIVDLYDMIASLIAMSNTSVNGGGTALGKLPVVGGLLQDLTDTLNNKVQGAFTTVTQFIADTVGQALGQVADLSISGVQKVVLPVSYTDPDFSAQTSTGNQTLATLGVGDFAQLVVSSTPTFYGVSPKTPVQTSIVYQRVNTSNLQKQYDALTTEQKLSASGVAARLVLQNLSATKYNDSDPLNATSPDAIATDTDQDGVSDFNEMYIDHTNEHSADTDQDGLTDLQEKQYGTKAGMPDDILAGNENALKADQDSDGDGLSDYDEVTKYHTNPMLADTDGDGVSDGAEIKAGTNPLMVDTDGDGIVDGKDTDPLGGDPKFSEGVDTDGDGIPDAVELQMGTDPNNPDTDGDGLNDFQELQYGTNPLKADTDEDGVSDGQEVLDHTNPLKADTDGDGLTDGEEKTRGTNPLMIDTDGDGYNDGRAAQTASELDIETAFENIGGVELSSNAIVKGNSTDGYTVTGQGTAGSTVKVTDASGATVGTGTIGTDGNYSITIPASVGAKSALTLTPTKGSSTGDSITVMTPGDAAGSGSTSGSNSGNNSGSTSGDNSGSTSGNNSGNNSGSTSGDNSGSTSGNNSGSTSGDNSGSTSGNNSGSTSGDNSGSTSGNNSGDNSGSTSGNNSGNNSGSTSGDNSGSTSGNNSGSTSGNNSGNNSGSTSGDNSGSTSGNNSGNNSGSTSGDNSGSTSGNNSGNNSGSTSGDNSGSTSGNNSGSTSGDNSGSTSGNNSGNNSGSTSGDNSGSTSGNNSGNNSGSTSGDNSGSTSGNNSGNNSGSTSGDNSGSTSGNNSGNNSGSTSGNNSGNNSGSTSGNNSGSTSGDNSGSTSGNNSGNNSGSTSGDNSGSTSGNNSGNNSGSTSGDNSGSTSGNNSGNNSGSTSGDNSGSTSGNNSGNNSGSTSGDNSGSTSGNNSGNNSGSTSGDNSGSTSGNNSGSGATMTSPTGVSVNKQADGSVVITGKGEAGATITARDADGKSIATTTVGTDGTFTLTLPKSAVTSGDKITVVQQKDGKTSDVLNITVPADQPTGMTVNIDANGNVHVVGKGTPGSTVYIFTADGDSLASGKVGADGNFDILVPTDSSKPGTILAIVQATNGGLSNAIGIKVPAKQPTKVVFDNEDGNIVVSGEGTPGATITVTDSEGNKVAQGTVDKDGKFTITVPKGSVKPGDSISVTTTDGGNDSNPIKVTVPSEKPGSMTVTNGDKDVTVTGTGKPGATITITDSTGKEIGKTTVGSDGKFTLTVSKDGLAAGDKLYVTSTDGGVASNPVGITIPAQGTTTDANGNTISTGNGTGTTTGNGSNTGNGTGTTTGNGSSTGNGTGTTTGNGSSTGNGTGTTAGNGSTTGTNGNGTVAGGGSNLGKLANDSSKQATSNNGSLPQTNDSVEGSLAVAGTIMLGLVGLLGARRRREDMI